MAHTVNTGEKPGKGEYSCTKCGFDVTLGRDFGRQGQNASLPQLHQHFVYQSEVKGAIAPSKALYKRTRPRARLFILYNIYSAIMPSEMSKNSSLRRRARPSKVKYRPAREKSASASIPA